MYRRVTIIGVIVAIVLILVLGFYFAYMASNANGGTAGQPVTAGDLATLKQIALAPYGPSGISMLSSVKNYTGTPLTAQSKPLVVYIGADYCPFCSIQRWPLIIALDRFGNFSRLVYMASSPSEGDYPTFSFHTSTYSSNYLVFQGYEQQDRNNQPLDAVPSNYTGVFSQYGSAYPFSNFGNRYIIPGAMMSPVSLTGKTQADVLNDIKTGTSLGIQIKEAANVITALICKLTNNHPTGVCMQSPINGLVLSLAAYTPGSLGTVAQFEAPTSTGSPWAVVSSSGQRD